MLSHGVVVGSRRDTLSTVRSRRLLQGGMLQRVQGCRFSQIKMVGDERAETSVTRLVVSRPNPLPITRKWVHTDPS